MLTLQLIVMLTLTFNFQPVKASGTIYIRADGSVDPPTANITSVDKVTYTFTGNIFDYSIVVERDNIVVDGAGYTLQGTGSGEGVTLSGRSNVTIKNMKIKAFYIGIYLDGSSSNSITGNNITNNNSGGVYISYSSYNIVSGNNITGANLGEGICLEFSSSYNTVSGNEIANNSVTGVYLYDSSSYNSVSGNRITNNGGGIGLDYSPNNVLRNNSMADNLCNIGVWGESLSDFVNDVDASNTVDGKPVYYWINRRDEAVPLDAGYVALVNCTNIIVQNLKLTKCDQGVLLAYTTNSTITKNKITANGEGIYLWSSSGNTVSGNNITNNEYGIFPESSNNKFYHNNFIDNTEQVYPSTGYVNVWDDGYRSGGNYWSNYAGVDKKSGPNQDQPGSDGIGDTSYIIDANNIDHYPLMSPFPQTPDFDIVVSPSTGTTTQGTTLTTNVYVSTIAGYNYLVSLSASGQPEEVTINFNPNTGTPDFTSTMTIQVGYSVPPNTYSITVTGLGSDDTTHSNTYTLTVTPIGVPEFPLGVEVATAISLIATVAYIWTRKRKTKPTIPKRFTTQTANLDSR